MTAERILEQLVRSARPWGGLRRLLRIGDWRVLLKGLDAPLANALDRRWGAFLSEPDERDVAAEIEFHRASPPAWLEQRPGEAYRVEGAVRDGRLLVWSYHFAAMSAPARSNRWHAALVEHPAEPAERLVDNLTRYLIARLAAAAGGFAVHGAGVLRDRRAWLFAGPSGAGKSTAVALSSPSVPLGDDFAIAVAREGGWVSAAVPFDNHERVTGTPPTGWLPLAGIWRLQKAVAARVEDLTADRAAASLMACTAFPWAMPDLLPSVLEATGRLAADGLFHHLHFARRPDFWEPLSRSAPAV